jgi:hypothetical protein
MKPKPHKRSKPSARVPAEFIVPHRVVLTRESGERVLERIRNPEPAPEALRKLLGR